MLEEEVGVGAHHYPRKVGWQGESRGVVVRREVLRRLEKRLAYRQVVQAQLQQLRRLKQERPQRTRTAWRRWGVLDEVWDGTLSCWGLDRSSPFPLAD